MADREDGTPGAPQSDDAWERELERLGPLMLRQEQTESEEPDAGFVRSLRARLVEEPAAGQPAEPAPRSGAVPSQRRRRRRIPVFWGGLAAAAIAAAIVALIIDSRRAESPGGQPQRAAFALPTPGKGDLTRSFPLLGGIGAGGAAPAPWTQTLEIPNGGPYPGHLRLTGVVRRFGPPEVTAYRLAGPSFAAPRLGAMARTLGIGAAVKRSTRPDGTWAYVWNFKQGGSAPIDHSVAVNLRTGELRYHDFGPSSGPSPAAPLNAPQNVAIARRWLARIGWVGTTPIHTPTSRQERDLTNTVTLGWTGVGPSNVPAAILRIDHGTVIDADLWPPWVQSAALPALGYPAGWAQVLSGKVPLAVQITIGDPFNNGTGRLRSIGMLAVFTEASGGALYLAPAYEFQGPARIHGVPGPRRWFALVTATSR